MAESARRGGEWVKCRPGCTPCCLGPFEITALDAMRLHDGLRALTESDPARAALVRERSTRYVKDALPMLGAGGELPESWDDVPCPVLDPDRGTCDLYESRPLLCRTFGAATKRGGTVGACELCYEGASDAEIEAAAVDLPDVDEGLERAAFPFLALVIVADRA